MQLSNAYIHSSVTVNHQFIKHERIQHEQPTQSVIKH